MLANAQVPLILLDFVRPHGWLALLALLTLSTAVCFRFGGRGYVFMVALTGALYAWLDHRWVRDAMEHPDWDGTPDQDGVFAIGVLLRIAVVSAMLFSTLVVGFWLSKRYADMASSGRHTGV